MMTIPIPASLPASAALAAFVMLLGMTEEARSAEVYRAEYSVSLLGLRVARSQFVTTVDHGDFTTKGTLATAGLVRVFERADGETSVTGRVDGTGMEPASYRLSYHYGRKPTTVSIEFSRGEVVKAERDPPTTKKGDWVEVTPGDLKSVTDPLSALLVKAPSPRAVCDRTLRIFDGATRVDLKLEFAGWQPFSTDGFKGVATSCRVAFVPVSGYRRGVSGMTYLSREKDLRIAFATLGDSGIYAPVFARVGTELGDVTVYATRFEAATGNGQ
jgi:hypothetical protein